MADISVIIKVLGNEDIERATKSMSSLEGRVDTLRKSLKQGRISEDQFKQGLKEIRRSIDSQFPSWQKAKAAIDNYRKSLDRMEQSKAVEQATQDYRRLAAAIDPVERITQEYQRSVRTLDNALENNVITLDEYNRRLATVKGNMEKAGVTFNQYGQVANVNTRRLKRFSSVGLQQVGYQVGDFAVQLQGGTNIAVAFGQQMSQLLGIFGAGGAIAGAGVAIATAFIAPLLDAKEKVSDLDNQFNELGSTLQSIKEIRLDGISREFAEQAEAAKQSFNDILGILERVELRNLKQQLQAPLKAVLQEIKSFDFRSQIAGRYGDVDFNSALGLESRQEALFLATQLKRLDGETKEELQGQVESIAEALMLRGILTPEVEKMLAKLATQLSLQEDLNQSAEKSKEEAEKTADAVGMIDFTGATAGANALADMLGVSADKAVKLYRTLNQLAGIKVSKKGAGRLTPFGTPDTGTFGGFTGAGGGLEFSGDFGPNVDDFIASGGTTGGSSGGGGGGGMSAAEKQAQEFDKARKALAGLVSQYDEGVERAEKLRDAQITVNEAINAGVISADQGQQVMSDYIDSLKDAENPMQKIADTMRSSLGDAFMSIVDGSKSAGDAFKDMARLVLKQAFELLVIKPILDSLFGGSSGGGLLGGALSFLGFANGAAFSNGKVTAFADGGVVNQPTMFPMANGMGLMGEAGPEAVMPLKRGKNGKLGVQVEGGSQQPVVINQSFNFSANGDDSVKRIIAQEAPKIANLTQKQILDQRRRGGVMKSTFG